MEFNIALNTIVYLMIFLFPGIIFRKFLFIREYSKEFDKGNLFERFIWTILTSIIILLATFSIFLFLKNILNLDLLPSISYKTIWDTFNDLSNNKLPDPDKKFSIQDKDVYKHFFLLMISIYILSIILGIITYLVTRTTFVKSIGVLKYLNYWQDLVKGTYNSNNDDTLTYAYTTADVLTEQNDTTKLYSGRVINYYLDLQTNQLQTIVLSDAKRYKKLDDGGFEIKSIPGHNFIIEKERILNINFTYIYESKDENKVYKWIYRIVNTIFILLFIGVISTMFFSNIYIYTSTFLRKSVFVICGVLLILILNKNVKKVLSGQWSTLKTTNIYFFISFLLPYIWLFNFLKWYWVLSLEFVFLILMSFLLPDDQTDGEASISVENNEPQNSENN
ncbi:hypothetical protein [Chryseobacterium rhizosphaerae]|uniref:hypothetical protein n=1 Tax=Chryseobacterium rhizosphaerae TaxID=395937 RepID=UPI002359A874|nr:hypothetical protein [Chryseobacterium rhizosphaerae]MDC8102511.1 hypothetical protein [Chryseobacterium rhizosphaerae]